MIQRALIKCVKMVMIVLHNVLFELFCLCFVWVFVVFNMFLTKVTVDSTQKPRRVPCLF